MRDPGLEKIPKFARIPVTRRARSADLGSRSQFTCNSEEMEVATLQLRYLHARKRNRVMSVNHDDRPCLGIVRLTKNLCSRLVRKQRVIEGDHILTGVEILDRFLAETWVEHKRVATTATIKATDSVHCIFYRTALTTLC